MKTIVLSLSLLFAFNLAVANVKLNSLFTDHMVLQKGKPVSVWGTADEGEGVKVTFNGQSVSTTTVNGKWMVKLAPMPYLTKGSTMVIAGKNTLTVNDVLVGEVWLCSGQSNMERELGLRRGQQPITDWEKERDEANYPLIRSFYVPEKYAKEPIDDVNGSWKVCSPETVPSFSAVAYFFARDLYKQLNVPIGILFSAYGGTRAEDWTSKEALAGAKGIVPPAQITNGLYNAMIAPLLPVAIKGVAWYQGENNSGRAKEYQVVLPNMIKNWRTDFKQGDFPFLIVQIAPHKGMPPEIRESQLLASQQVKHTALIVTTDCGDANDIHPPHKQPVGERLALAARHLAYKENIEYSGPVYRSYKIKDNRIVLSFDHAAKGFLQNAEAIKGFTIAGEDQIFKVATAILKGNKVILFNEAIKKPVSVRYGWANVPDVNLYNVEGLPASPFRTAVEISASSVDVFKGIKEQQNMSSFHGFECADFIFNNRNCKVVKPKKAAVGLPWIWRARFWGHEPQTDIALLEQGFHVVYCDVAELYGNKEAIDIWDNFYAYMRKLGLAKKVVLEGMSRGGVYVYNWAAHRPNRVACVYADAPVLDLKSWPGGKGAGKGSATDWELFKKDYQLPTEEAAAKFKGSPLDKVKAIVKGKFPMLHVVGDADEVVPVAENTKIFEEKVKAAGGQISVIHKPGVGHHPHSLTNPAPIVNFILSAMGMANTLP